MRDFNLLEEKASIHTSILVLLKDSVKQSCHYNSLTQEHITDDEHSLARNVFDAFEMKTLLDYHDLYLMTDIFLLIDVMVSFRKMCLDFYKIDPLHLYIAPGFAWQAALRMTGVE